MRDYYKPIDDKVWLDGNKFEFIYFDTNRIVEIRMYDKYLVGLKGYCLFDSELSQTLLFSSLGLSVYPYPIGENTQVFNDIVYAIKDGFVIPTVEFNFTASLMLIKELFNIPQYSILMLLDRQDTLRFNAPIFAFDMMFPINQVLVYFYETDEQFNRFVDIVEDEQLNINISSFIARGIESKRTIRIKDGKYCGVDVKCDRFYWIAYSNIWGLAEYPIIFLGESFISDSLLD